MTSLTHKRAKVNGVTLHYVTAGRGPTVLCMHGWPQNHREFLPVIENLADEYAFIAPDLRGYADSDKPYDGYEPKTIAQDMVALLRVEDVQSFHILSHDLGGRRLWHWPTPHLTVPCHLPQSRRRSSD